MVDDISDELPLTPQDAGLWCPEVKSRGRPPSITDETLLSVRNNLVGLLESSWGEVGWNLRRIKTRADVRAALQVWEGTPILPYPATSLLRPSEQPVSVEDLNTLEERKSEVLQALSRAEAHRRSSVNSLEKATRAASQVDLEERDRVVVADEVETRSAKLKQADEELLSFRSQLANLDETIKDSHAFLARTEVMKFCKSGRYALNPFNTANALAGLPFIGYRQSINRCRKWPREDGLPYQVFLLVRRIFDSREHGVAFVQHAENLLRVKRRAESHAITELRWNWYYLRRSIEAVAKAKPLPRAMSYRITAEYSRRTSQPTAVERLFEEDERIVV